jgi:hypothetical protein
MITISKKELAIFELTVDWKTKRNIKKCSIMLFSKRNAMIESSITYLKFLTKARFQCLLLINFVFAAMILYV